MTTATKERPILFSGPMVRAILDGRKTVTRRIVKWDGVPNVPPTEKFCAKGEAAWQETCDPGYWIGCNEEGTAIFARCPFGVPGDRLWVREGFCYERDPITAKLGKVLYKADGEDIVLTDGDGFVVYNKDGTERRAWQPSIHMPRDASRLTLEVVSVRVERLIDGLTDAEAALEGIDAENIDPAELKEAAIYDYTVRQNRFANLWCEINGTRSWESNPWVWRVEFKRFP